MSAYRCPECGTRDPTAWQRCYWGGCPDGRDLMPALPPPPAKSIGKVIADKELAQQLATARTEARKAALEEAAKLAEMPGVWRPHPDVPDCFRIASAIRALIGTDPTTDRGEG